VVQLKTQPVRQQVHPRTSIATDAIEVWSFDTETTGVDFRHGARPFFVTSALREEPLQPLFWQWRVDPLTRMPIIPAEDIEEVREHLHGKWIVMQNGKFDVNAMNSVDPRFGRDWDWGSTDDTLLMAHLLTSNRPKSLDVLSETYLGLNIKCYEQKVKEACDTARRYCRSRLKTWQLAKKRRADMPSAKEECWKLDMWLPRAIIHELGGTDKLSEHYGEDMSWWETVVEEYANADASVTVSLRGRMLDVIRDRNLEPIYQFRRKLLPVAYKMETRGVTLSKERLDQLYKEYTEASDKAERLCVNIAKGYGHKLKMPKGASVNKSLQTFVFDVLGLEKVYNPKASKNKNKTEKTPTLDSKNAIPHYLDTLKPNSKELLFIKTLAGKRSRDTACTFMRMYSKFWQPVRGWDGAEEVTDVPGWYRLHPNYKPTATDTLRWGCDNPAVQNISKKENFNLRFCFGPAPGREWWSLDAKNIELRLPFYESGEQLLIDLFEHPDDPPFYGSNHLLNFSVIYPDLWAAAVKEVGLDKAGPHCKKKYAASWYQWCKNGNFAIQYGAVDKADGTGTADRAFHKPGAHALLKARFKNLEKLNKWVIAFANQHGYVETIPDRTVDRHRGYPLLCTRTEYGKILETVPLSYRVQGSAMWWTGKAQVRCQAKLDDWQSRNFDGFICMQVHDEMVFDFPKSQVDPREHLEYVKRGERIPLFQRHKSNLWRIQILADLMAQGGADFVLPSCPNGIPTPVGVEYHTESWSEGVTLAI
jgi:DNA polymerase I-like protein with 3'-5' exonuclease and polymerase domains